MEKMFGPMMGDFFNSMSEEDKQKMKVCFETMSAMCPCGKMKDMSEEDKRVMMEKIKSFCGGKMGMMSSFVQRAGLSK